MTLEAYAASLSAIEQDAGNLVASLSDAQGNWQPENGRRWSITQNLQHLARTNEIYVRALRDGLAGAPARDAAGQDLAAIPGWFGRWFVRMMEPPPRLRVKARRAVQPPSSGSLRDALDGFLASHGSLRELMRDAAARDLRVRFKSPFGPIRLSIATGLLVLAAHDRRHLWQARQVTGAEGFPPR